jgi:pyrimidine-specific ribonucleoside hydrolase
MIRKMLSLGLIFLLAACETQSTPRPTPTPFSGTPRPVVIDTDMGADDRMAILYLLNRLDVEIKAITVTGTGLAHAGPGATNALGLAALAGHADIPVAAGRQTPLLGDHAFPSDWRADADMLSGLSLPSNPNLIASQTAIELLTSTIESSPAKITILALGPLTDVAEMLQAKPSLKENIEAIYIMGGAVEVEGNVASSNVGIANRYAEWNIYCDPYAASIVFESGLPITLIPLDATNLVPATMNFYNRIKNDHASPEATFVFDSLTKYRDLLNDGYYFWDPLAAVILSDDSLATFETKMLTVTEEGNDSGRTQVSENGASIRVAVNADSNRFEQLFLDTLNAPE